MQTTAVADPGHGGRRWNSTTKEEHTVKTLLNLIWLIFSGLWLAIGYYIAGIICCILIVTIPWGIASFRIGNYALWPFGRE
ncbi:YccF domain-containing protein, partial [Burkholderia multivorans]|uniref:YccF domain-containing protein n=1 Tax=Burkholderia multivorans TaxID=87883 RepID=UPI00325FB2A6